MIELDAPELRDPVGRRIGTILASALDAADAHAAVRRALPDLDLMRCGPASVVVVALGKAAPRMADALLEGLGNRVRQGIVVGKSGQPRSDGPWTVRVGNHPIPGPDSLAAGAAVEAVVSHCSAADTVVVALSGGASALVATPVQGVSLDALATATRALLLGGVDIAAINAVRSHVERLKGGGLARLAAPAKVVTVIVSDVVGVGDPLSTVGSGPTAGDPSRWRDAAAAVATPGVDVGPAVDRVVSEGLRGERPETIHPVDPALADVDHWIVADNAAAVRAALSAARSLGFSAEEGPPLQGEARTVGETLARQLVAWPATEPRCVVLGGETTVTVTGDGRGGRNQELALAAARVLRGHPNARVVALATDGEDGPTDAAGAIVGGQTVDLAAAWGVDVEDALRRNDSHGPLSAAGALLRTGPTGTNVCDLVIGLVDPRA